MSNYEEQIQKIVSLKRYETPRDGYFEDFLEEFQQHQRGELLRKSSASLFIERVGTWFREVGSVKWVAGAGVAYAGIMAAVLLWPAGPGTVPSRDMAPASFEGSQHPSPVPSKIEEAKGDEQGTRF